MEYLRSMDNADDSFFEENWNTSLRDDLLVDYSPGPSWNSFLTGFMHDSPLPRTFPSQPSPSNNNPPPPPVSRQPPQNHNTQAGSSTCQTHPSNSINQRRSHLDPPNFPLPSNTSTSRRPLPSSNHSLQPAIPIIQDLPSPSPRPPTPSSDETFWSSPESSDTSIRSDTPFPQAEDLGDFIDLTQDSSSPTMAPVARPQPKLQKRRNAVSPRGAASPSSRATSTTPLNPAKRRKTEASQSSNRSAKIEEIDLRDVDDDNGLSKVLEQQRLATIKAQQEQANKPVKLSTLKCIICMENMKDLTATHCGHLFCHACLMEALIAGENQGSEPGKGISKCPVCRKKVARPTEKQKRDVLNVVPLAMKIRVRSNIAKGKARAI